LRKDVGGGLQIQLEEMEATSQHRTGWRQVVCGLALRGAMRHKSGHVASLVPAACNLCYFSLHINISCVSVDLYSQACICQPVRHCMHMCTIIICFWR